MSPVDGTVLIFGEINGNKVEQIKGLTYELESLIGDCSLHYSIKQKNIEKGNHVFPGHTGITIVSTLQLRGV